MKKSALSVQLAEELAHQAQEDLREALLVAEQKEQHYASLKKLQDQRAKSSSPRPATTPESAHSVTTPECVQFAVRHPDVEPPSAHVVEPPGVQVASAQVPDWEKFLQASKNSTASSVPAILRSSEPDGRWRGNYIAPTSLEFRSHGYVNTSSQLQASLDSSRKALAQDHSTSRSGSQVSSPDSSAVPEARSMSPERSSDLRLAQLKAQLETERLMREAQEKQYEVKPHEVGIQGSPLNYAQKIAQETTLNAEMQRTRAKLTTASEMAAQKDWVYQQTATTLISPHRLSPQAVAASPVLECYVETQAQSQVTDCEIAAMQHQLAVLREGRAVRSALGASQS